MSSTTLTALSYSGTTQVATVDATYGIPVTAHIWGAGGGSSSLYPGAGGSYSRVNFVAKPGDILTVAVGQGGGAGGKTAPPPAPPQTWSTRNPNYTGTTLYPGYPFPQGQFQFLAAYGVWSVQYGGPGTSISDTWTVNFPVSGLYLIQGQSLGTSVNPYSNPNGNPGTLSIDGAAVLTASQGGFLTNATVYVAAGNHSVSVVADSAYARGNVFQSVAFTINQANPSTVPNTPAGVPGASYIGLYFNTRFPPPGQADPVYAYGNGDSFLDQWGVWGPDQNNTSFTRQYTINFPQTANVIFQMASSMIAQCTLDGDPLINSSPALPYTTGVSEVIKNITAGNHILIISGTGSIGALNRIGLIFGTGDQTSYSGGRGGISEPDAFQGFGGGGGGATILSLNGVVIGVGAGGGGGATEPPNPNNSSSAITNALFNGQNGQDVIGRAGYTLGGGGGGGGGGARGGNGGAGVSGANGALTGNGVKGGYSGYNGLSLGDDKVDPTGRLPYVNEFYPGGGVAEGGSASGATAGGNGYVLLEYRTGGGAVVKDGGDWKSVQKIFVKHEDQWQEVLVTYINVDGIWKPIKGAPVPVFNPVNAAFGALPRPYSAGALFAPPPPAPSYDYSGFTGYGSSDMF